MGTNGPTRCVVVPSQSSETVVPMSAVRNRRTIPMYFFHVVPYEDRWSCKRGARVLEVLDTYAEAIYVAESEASVHRPSEVLVHDETGHVEVVSRFVSFD